MYFGFSFASTSHPTGAMVARQTSNSPVWISYLKAVGSTPTLGSVSLFILFLVSVNGTGYGGFGLDYFLGRGLFSAFVFSFSCFSSGSAG